jgi:hypothetical protein
MRRYFNRLLFLLFVGALVVHFVATQVCEGPPLLPAWACR